MAALDVAIDQSQITDKLYPEMSPTANPTGLVENKRRFGENFSTTLHSKGMPASLRDLGSSGAHVDSVLFKEDL